MLSVAPEKAPVRPSGSSPPPPRVDPPPEPELPSLPSAAPQTAGMPATMRAVVARAAPTPSPALDPDAVHLVFSTDCSGYQHWQSIALWYSAQRVGHTAPVTRIASSCDESARAPIAHEWARIDPAGRFRVHFTPPMELKGGSYKYSNKPGGLRHWLAHAQPAVAERFVALLDPDQILLRPITVAIGAGLRPSPSGRGELVDADGVPRLLARDARAMPQRVARRQAAAQQFGIGGAWANAMTPKARPSWVHFSRAKVCGEGAPCTRTSPQLAETSYSVGPPYIAHIDDWREIADQWWDMMPRVHAQYPHLLAEMYAFSMAAANLTLPIAQLHHLMVSDVGAGGEGWPWVERLAETGAARALCAGAGPHTPPASTRDPRAALPSVLHHCQRYSIAKSNFAKRQVPHDFFSCGARALPFSHADIVAQLESSAAPSRQLKRHAFMVCNLVPRINAAQRDYQRTLCGASGNATRTTRRSPARRRPALRR